MSKVVRLGDPSSHGGYMISASAGFTNSGVRVCVDGDMHVCPIKGHGTTPISASSSAKSDGNKIARVGDTAACGASIVSGGSVEMG